MLKIKDNVDLKELEKYGVKLRYSVDEDTGETWIEDIYKLRGEGSLNYSIQFIRDTFGIYYLKYIESTHIDLLYDLIKADLVEKEIK